MEEEETRNHQPLSMPLQRRRN